MMIDIASQILSSIYNEEENTYEELKELLISYFDKSPTKETKMKILFSRRKKMNESVLQYAQDIRRLSKDCECQNLEIQLFINGLPNFIKEYVLLSKPESVDDYRSKSYQRHGFLQFWTCTFFCHDRLR